MLGRLVFLQIGMVAALRADDMQAPLLQNAEEQPAVDDPIDQAPGHENVEADIIIDIPINPENLIPTFVDALTRCDLDLVMRCVAAGANADLGIITDPNLEPWTRPLQVVSSSDVCSAENEYNVVRYLLEHGANPIHFLRTIIQDAEVDNAEEPSPAAVLCKNSMAFFTSLRIKKPSDVYALMARARKNGEAFAFLNSNHYFVHPPCKTAIAFCAELPTLGERTQMMCALLGLPWATGKPSTDIALLQQRALCVSNPSYRAFLHCRNWSRTMKFADEGQHPIADVFGAQELMNLVLRKFDLNMDLLDRVNDGLTHRPTLRAGHQQDEVGEEASLNVPEEVAAEFDATTFDASATNELYHRIGFIRLHRFLSRVRWNATVDFFKRAVCCFYCGTTRERCQDIALALWIAFLAACLVMTFAGVFGHAK